MNVEMRKLLERHFDILPQTTVSVCWLSKEAQLIMLSGVAVEHVHEILHLIHSVVAHFLSSEYAWSTIRNTQCS